LSTLSAIAPSGRKRMKSSGSVSASAREAGSTPKLTATVSHTYRALMGRREPPMVTSRAQHRAASARSMDSERGTTQNGMDKLSSTNLYGHTSSADSYTWMSSSSSSDDGEGLTCTDLDERRRRCLERCLAGLPWPPSDEAAAVTRTGAEREDETGAGRQDSSRYSGLDAASRRGQQATRCPGSRQRKHLVER
jgi:hypothetical protein